MGFQIPRIQAIDVEGLTGVCVCVEPCFLVDGSGVVDFRDLIECALPLFVVKWLAEFAFHRTWFLKYSFRARLIDSLLLSMLFPGYYVTVGVVALVAPRFEWKGRPYDR